MLVGIAWWQRFQAVPAAVVGMGGFCLNVGRRAGFETVSRPSLIRLA